MVAKSELRLARIEGFECSLDSSPKAPANAPCRAMLRIKLFEESRTDPNGCEDFKAGAQVKAKYKGDEWNDEWWDATIQSVDGEGMYTIKWDQDVEGEDGTLEPDAIAETYLHIHRQHRSAWTWEVELRPWVENF